MIVKLNFIKRIRQDKVGGVVEAQEREEKNNLKVGGNVPTPGECLNIDRNFHSINEVQFIKF